MRTKMLVSSLLASLIAFMSSSTMAMPFRGEIQTSAGGVPTVVPAGAKSAVSAMSVGSYSLTLTPLLMPVKLSVSWVPSADKVIADERVGSLTTNTTVTTPTDYAVCNGRVSWYNLVYSESTPLWGSVLNPPAPCTNELGQVVWELVDARSKSGANDLSLDMLSLTSFSNDGNSLGDTVTFTGMSYTLRAILIKADGTVITDGFASQKGARVLVLVFTKLFNGGATQAGLNEVRDWVGSFGNFGIGYTAQVIGNDATKSYATLSVVGVPPRPILQMSRAGVSVTNGEAGRTYQVYSRAQVLGNAWDFEGVVSGSDILGIKFTGTTRFYRAKVQ